MYTYMSIYTSNYIYLCFKRAFKNLKLIVVALVKDTTVVQKISPER